MKAIILAAGRGCRMKDLTDERPKCLLELRDRPLLDWQLDALRTADIKDIAIVTGYRRDLLATRGLVEFYNSRWAETNMVSSLACADAWLQAGPCIVSYSDIFYEAEAVELLKSAPGDIAITYDPNWLDLWKRRFEDPLDDAETFQLNADCTLAEIGNKPTSISEIQGQYMGLLRFTPKGWAEVERIRLALMIAERDRMHMTGTLQRVIEGDRVKIHALAYKGMWGEFDIASDFTALS